MPAFELPLEQLQEYMGSTPLPDDHREVWDRFVREMSAVDSQVKLQPAAFNTTFAEFFDLWFTGVGGARIHAKYGQPLKAADVPHPAVLMFHGYSTNSGDWFNLLPYLARGFTVAALDCRGQGGLSEDPGGQTGTTLRGHIVRGIEDAPDGLLFRKIFLDCAQLARIIMDMPGVDADRVGATGWSQGGGLTLACAALEPRIRRAAPVLPFLSDYRRALAMELTTQPYEELRTYFRVFDPQHQREEEIWTRLGYVDVQHLASRIQADVLMGIGLMDSVCPPSTQFAAFNHIRAAKRLVTYPDFEHESLPGMYDLIFDFLSGL